MEITILLFLTIAVLALSYAIIKYFSNQLKMVWHPDHKKTYLKISVISILVVAFIPLLSLVCSIYISPLSWKSIFQSDLNIPASVYGYAAAIHMEWK